LAVEVLEDRTLPSTFVVDRLTDTGAGSGLAGDLRYCITKAVDNDKITFDDSVTGTINLSRALPALSHSVSIEGPGANLLTVRRDTGGYYGIFTVNNGTTVSIAGLTITNGNNVGGYYGNGISNNGGTLTLNNATVSGNSGNGCIFNNNGGTLTLNGSTVSGNSGDGIDDGGGGTLALNNSTVSNNSHGSGIDIIGTLGLSTLTLNNSSVSDNAYVGIGTGTSANFTLNNSTVSGNGGGGIGHNYGGTLTLNNCTVSGNSSAGIGNYGTATLNNCTVSGNGGPGVYAGGGIINYSGTLSGTLTLNNCTVSGNSVGFEPEFGGRGGGIWNGGTLALNNCTVSGNSVPPGGDYGGGGICNFSRLYARNTIIAGNTASYGPDLYGSLSSSGYNLIGNSSGGSGYADTDLLDVDAKLGPLQDNGGPTKTIALLAGSPALNAGDPDQLGVADQRGVARSGGVNIGAYQASASAFVLTAPATVTAGMPFDLTVKAVDSFGQVAVGYTGTVTLATDDPKGTVPADYTFTADDAGSHTFRGGVTLYAGGSLITATDTADDTLTGSLVITFAEA
jgi:hypothetical protein